MGYEWMSIAAVAPTPLGWDVVEGSGTIAALSGFCGIRAWTGRMRRVNGITALDSPLGFLAVTLLPGSVFSTCVMATAALSHIRLTRGDLFYYPVTLIEISFGVLAGTAFCVAMSLLFFSRPRRFVPPLLRDTL